MAAAPITFAQLMHDGRVIAYTVATIVPTIIGLCAWLARFVKPTSRFGKFINTIAQNGPVIDRAAQEAAQKLQQQKTITGEFVASVDPRIPLPPVATAPKGFLVIPFLALLLLSIPARAQTSPAKGSTPVGRYTLNWGPLTGVDLFTVTKNSAGKPILTGPTQGMGGAMIDLGFGPAINGQDRWHLGLPVEFGGGVAGTTAAATFATGLMLGWGGFDQVPEFALGPGVSVPLASTAPPSFAMFFSIAALNLIKSL